MYEFKPQCYTVLIWNHSLKLLQNIPILHFWNVCMNNAINYISWIKIGRSGSQVWVAGLGLVQSHPLHRMCFRQCQASSAVLGWPGDGDRYLVHNIQSSDWPYLYEHGVSLCRYLLIGECMTIHAARGVSSTIISRNDVYATCVWV